MKQSILNEGVTLKAQSGAILKTTKQLEALAKETAFADMIKEGMPIYKASEVLKMANNLETIPYNEYQGFTTAGRLKSMDFNVGNESAFDNALSDKRAINNEIVRTNRKIQNLQNEIADYTQKHKELSDNLNLLRASRLKAHKIDGRNKSRLNWFNEQFNYDNRSDLEQLQYYDLWINRMKDEIKSLSANIPTSLFESGGILKAQKGKVIKAIGEAVKGSSKPALVKYYAPTMGKTFAAKSNPLLVDFDDIIRDPSRQILDTYGFKSKSDMYNSGNTDAISAYENMLVEKLNGLRTNLQYNGKTVVVSPTAVANPDKIGFRYDNIPSIPVKNIFIERNIGRGGTPGASEMWYDSLMRQYPGFNIENRFVSELEPMPTNEQWDALYNAAVESGDKKEVQRLRDMHFKAKSSSPLLDRSGNLAHNYHATKANFTIFDPSKAGTGSGNTANTKGVFYFTPYKEASIDVFHPYGLDEYNKYKVIDAYIHSPKTVEIPLEDFKKTWFDEEAFGKLRDIGTTIVGRATTTPEEMYQKKLADWEKAVAKYNGNPPKYLIKPTSPNDFMEESLVDNIATTKPEYIKLADPITYDDNGNIIPLSKRDNFSNPDIRYGIIPLVGLGLGAAATQKEKNGGTIKSIFNEIHN